MTTGEKLREVIQWSTKTQKDLSKMTGISQSVISSYVTGSRTPPHEALQKIADALGVSIFLFLNGEPLPADYTELTAAERQLLGDYRLLTVKQQEFIAQNIALLKQQNSR